MSDVQADHRSYYEEEARQGVRGLLKGRRVELRADCLALLRRESRHSIVDFGAGPGRDAPAFLEAGHSYLGIDLAHGNGVLASERGINVVHGSIAAPPLRPASFDAGWSMSTLMHLPEAEVPTALAAMTESLRAGSPFFVAQWGGSLGDHVDETKIAGQRRLFSLRSFERNRQLVSEAGEIEREEVWPVGPEGWEYHVFVLRTPGV